MTLSVYIRHQFSGFNLDITFDAGSGVTALFGRSGAGKSTIAQAISGAFSPVEGQIVLNDDVLFSSDQRVNRPAHRRGIGYVFQQDLLFRIFRYGAIWSMRSGMVDAILIQVNCQRC